MLLEQALNRAKCRDNDSNAAKLIHQLGKNPRFMDWLQSSQSDFIYLNRSSEDSQIFSPLAAMLVQALRGVEPAKAIHFFCPIWDDDNPSGSYHMMRSLIVQLLSYPNNLAIAPGEISRPYNDPDQLKYLFFRLLSSIQGTIFIIIDGISRHWAENEEEAMSVAQLLFEASGEYFPSAQVKVLLTAPVPYEIAERLPDEVKLMLASDVGETHEFGRQNLIGFLSPALSEEEFTSNAHRWGATGGYPVTELVRPKSASAVYQY